MKDGRRGAKWRWTAATAAGVVVAILAAVLFRAPVPMPKTAGGSTPILCMGPPKVDSGGNQPDMEAALTDPTPLFLPTQWNEAENPPSLRVSVGSFAGYSPKLAFGDSEPELNMPAPIAVPARPADELAENPPGPPYIGIGETGAELPVPPKRGAFVDIVAEGTGLRVFAENLNGMPAGMADSPPEGGAWEFVAAVDAAGLVGPLVPTVRSGRAVDDFLLNYLTRVLQVGDRLPPGFYRISVGP